MNEDSRQSIVGEVNRDLKLIFEYKDRHSDEFSALIGC